MSKQCLVMASDVCANAATVANSASKSASGLGALVAAGTPGAEVRWSVMVGAVIEDGG